MSIARNGLFLYGANMVTMISGYLFWFVITKLIGSHSAEMIGLTSSTIALSTLFSTVALLGIPAAIQRFIGKHFFENDFASISALLRTSLILVFSVSVTMSLIILSLGAQVMSFTKLSWDLLVVSMLIMIALTVYQMIFSILVAISQSKYLLLSTIVQSLGRILMMVVLVYAGFGLNGLLISYLASTVISIPIMFLGISKDIRAFTNLNFLSNTKKLIAGGTALWVPTLISTIGGQLSVLVVISYSGAIQAGEYYVASIIFSAVIAIPQALVSTVFPVMSGKIDQSRILIWKVIKIGLMLSVPLAAIISIYSPDILRLLDSSLANASLPQLLFMMAVVPTILNYGVYYLLYAHGKYRHALAIGIADNLSKVVLYFILVPHFGSLGAVEAFIAGPFIAFLFIQLTQRHYLNIPWKKVIVIIGAPALIGVSFMIIRMNPIVGISLIIALSFCIYIRFIVIDIVELQELVFAILPVALAKKIYPRIEVLIKAIGQTAIFSD